MRQLLLSTSQIEKRDGVVFSRGFLYVIDRDVENSKLVLEPQFKNGTDHYSGYRQFNNRVVDFLPDDPDHILMTYGLFDSLTPGVYKVNLKTLKTKSLKRGSNVIQSWYTDRRGEVRIGQGRKEISGEWHMSIRDAAGKKWNKVSNYPGLEGNTDVYGFTSDPNEIIIGANNNQDTTGLYVYNLLKNKQTRKLFHHEKYDARGIISSPDGKKVIGATYLADSIKRDFFDPEGLQRQKQIEASLPGFQVSIIEQTPNGRYAIFKAYAATIPPFLFKFDFQTNQKTLIARDFPEIGNTKQGDVTKVIYNARDGFEIPGYMTTPPKVGTGEVNFSNLPFIIMPHGGPYARDTASFDYLAQFMASRGYAVLQMNFRGSEGYGSAHEEAGRKNWEIMQQDVEDGTRWLIEQGYADPNRICIVGWSYGGYAALMGAITDPDLYTCSASIAGVTDLKDMINDLKKYKFGKHTAKNFILKGFEDKHDIKENSPVKRARELTIPIFMAHGTKDSNVYFDQYTRMKKALKKSKSKTTFMKFKDEDHYFVNFENRTKLLKGLDKFLHENLGGSAAAP